MERLTETEREYSTAQRAALQQVLEQAVIDSIEAISHRWTTELCRTTEVPRQYTMQSIV